LCPHNTVIQSSRLSIHIFQHLIILAISEAKKLVRAPSAIGRKLETAIGDAGRTEKIILTPASEKLGAVIIVEEQKKEIEKAERDRKGPTILTDGSKPNSEAAGYRWYGRTKIAG